MTRVSSKQSNFFFGSNRNKPKLNLFRLFFGRFHETKQIFFGLFWFVSVFRTGIETTETNQNKPRKSPKTNLYKGVLETIIIFRFKPKQTETQPVPVVFRFVFSETKRNFFQVVSVFQTDIETTETNRTDGMGN